MPLILLSVNLNRIALLRNSRDIGIPSVLQASSICVAAGAGGITVHPRPDERHIRAQDVYELAEVLTVEFSIEGNPLMERFGSYPGLMSIVRHVRPAQCTLVPDGLQQSTSDHGWDVRRDSELLRPLIGELKDLGIRVSLFMDAEPPQMPLVAEMGVDRIELYTGPFARAFREDEGVDEVFEQYCLTAQAAQERGLGVNAGHDLNLENLRQFRLVPGLKEVSIGHALIADALTMGLDETVKQYLSVLECDDDDS